MAASSRGTERLPTAAGFNGRIGDRRNHMRVLSFVTLGLAVLLGGAHPGEAQDSPSIAYIDSQVVMQQVPGAREAEREFTEIMQEYEGELQAMGQEIDQLVTELQEQYEQLTPEQIEEREEEIRQKELEYNLRVEELEGEAQERRAELLDPILRRMSEAIEEIRQERELEMVFDAASQAILAANPDLNLTGEVIDRLSDQADDGQQDH